MYYRTLIATLKIMVEKCKYSNPIHQTCINNQSKEQDCHINVINIDMVKMDKIFSSDSQDFARFYFDKS